MNPDMYNILALIARYFFAVLMVLIVFRGWRVTVRDNRRARWLRGQSPDTGGVGQLLVNPGGKRRQAIPIPKEGVLGSSAKADIRLKYKDVLPMHAHIEEREGGLLIRPLGNARLSLGEGDFGGDHLFARDGDILTIGRQKLLVVLFEAPSPRSDPYPPIPYPGHGATAKAGSGEKPEPCFDEDAIWQNEKK